MSFIEEIAKGVVQNLTGTAILPLLHKLLGLQDEQLEALQAIREDVRTLVEGPWRESRKLLDLAEHVEGTARDVYLTDARAALFRAHSHEPTATPRRAVIGMNLAMVAGLLGDRQGAHRLALDAYGDQVATVGAAVPKTLRSLKSETAQFVGAFFSSNFHFLAKRSWAINPVTARMWVEEKYEQGDAEFAELIEDLYVSSSDLVHGKIGQLWRGVSGRLVDEAVSAEHALWRRQSSIVSGRPWRPFNKYVAVAGRVTDGGRQLMQLHHMKRDADRYRRTCEVLDPRVQLDKYELSVQLGLFDTRGIRIGWAA